MLLADVEELRLQQAALSDVVSSDAGAYAMSVSDQSPERFAEDMRSASRELVETYAPVSAEASALFYETQRPRAGARVEIAAASMGAQFADDLGWAFLPMFVPERFPDPLASVMTRVGGVVARTVLGAGRETIRRTAANDSLGTEVRRYARAGSCAFCAYMSSSEVVTEPSVLWHLDCKCIEVPWWEDNPMPAAPHLDEYEGAAVSARNTLERRQREMKAQYPNMRWRNFFKQFPDLAINTRNISNLMRQELGLAH